ncbi:serine hydrolase domain-containing protein [Sphingomonas mali]|uniref:serine hydrolase domain-containing protein n=1 Tax=Sphingomonas mali TaxID=40682 RepID=UPI0009FE7CB6|nr:serine hydrolase [Sphingomonas mali]
MASSPPSVASPSPDGLRRGSPSSAGVDSREILGFIDDVEAAGLELHNLMLWRDGLVVAEGWHWPYSGDRLRMTHSMTKSVTACAIGMLVDAGRLTLDQKVAPLFPEVAIDPDSRAARMTVEDLLTMRSGQGTEVSGSIWRGIATSWIAEFFRIPFDHEPGTTYVYSSAASYMLSAIVTRVTGQTIHDFLKPRLFDPLGITNIRWDVGPDGINPGGNGISFTTADGLKLGVLHAQRGLWQGQRILSERWVAEATRIHAGEPGDQYGYHWVVGDGHFAMLGVFVQMVRVFPGSNAVLAFNAAMDESKVVTPHLDRHFPAAFGNGTDAATDVALAERLKRWSEPASFVSTAPSDPAAFAGRWIMTSNDKGLTELAFEFDQDEARIVLVDGEGEHRLIAGRDGWAIAPAYLPGADLHHGYRMDGMPTAAGLRWIAENRIELVVHFLESAFRDTFVFSVAGDRLVMDRSVNINSGARAWPTMTAAREA